MGTAQRPNLLLMSDADSGSPFDVGEPFLTAPEVAARLHVTAQTVRNWIDQGTLPAIRVGRAFRVNPRDVDVLLALSLIHI